MKVTLQPDELVIGSAIGCRRHIECLRVKSPSKNFPDRDNILWATHVEAACAELAVCKLLNIYWTALAGPHAEGDVGRNLQVRSTRYPNGELIVRPSDPDTSTFVLVTCRAPDYEICGWIRGVDAKQNQYVRTNDYDPRPYWSVPQSDLHPINVTKWRERARSAA